MGANFFQVMQMMQQIRSNPQSVLQRFGIPQECNNPESVAKYLMDSGRVTQDQINQAGSMYKQFFGK